MTDSPLDLIYLTTMVNIEHDHHDLSDAVLYQPSEACNLVKKAIDKFTARYDHGHGWHPPTLPTTNYYLPPPASSLASMDPMQVLATLAFVAFLLQNLMALIDRLTMSTRITQARDDKTFGKAQEVHDAIKKFSTKKWDRKK